MHLHVSVGSGSCVASQLKAHKLSDVAIQLLQRLIDTENVGINAEWLKLQPWTSDAAGSSAWAPRGSNGSRLL